MSREDLVLKCIDGLFKGKYLYVTNSPAGEIIGSGSSEEYPHVSVNIVDEGLDPQHSRIYVNNNVYYLKDLSSSTGTWVSLDPYTPIQVGDVLRVGSCEYSVSQGPLVSLSEEWHTMFEDPPQGLIGRPLGEILSSVDEKYSSVLSSLPEELQTLVLQNEQEHHVIGYKSIPLFSHEIRGPSIHVSASWPWRVYRRISNDVVLVPGITFIIGRLEFEACRFNVGLHTDTGMRPSNEDAEVIIQNLFVGPSPVSYYGVFDGHGGSECSQFLKDNLHHYLRKYYADGFTKEAISKAFVECDEAFYAKDPELAKNVGSAGIVVIIEKNQLLCANVGDSRVLVSQSGNLVELTRDHKPNVPEEAERIQKNGGLVIFGRVMGRLAISRAFGDFEFKNTHASELFEEVTGPLLTCEPEIQVLEISNAHELVMLSCDGLFEVFTSQEALSFVREQLAKATPELQDLNAIAKGIVDEAIYTRRSGDNVSVILITLKSRIS